MVRLLSLVVFFATWLIGSWLAGPQMLPGSVAVVDTIIGEARSGALFLHLGATLARVLLAFGLAMTFGTALGILMGRSVMADRLGDPWLLILLNLPALVVIVLAYIWGGLTETAAIAAVAVNKLPTAIVTVREGARALDPALDEMARAFALDRKRTFRHVVVPRLLPNLPALVFIVLAYIWGGLTETAA